MGLRTPHLTSSRIKVRQSDMLQKEPARHADMYIAATAALYVTKSKSKSNHPLLDDDGKLSSAGGDAVAYPETNH